MHVALDARRYDSGMWIYLSSLIEELQKIVHDELFTLIIQETKAGLFPISTPNFSLLKTDLAIENHIRGELFRHVILPKQLVAQGVNIFHDPGYFLPMLGKRLNKVVTFHDMVPFVHKETNSKKYFSYMRTVITISARIADRIIADSEITKQDILRILKLPESKVKVIYLAARKIFQPLPDPTRLAAVRARLNLTRPYILNVGTIEPRKNIQRLLEAYHSLRKLKKIPHQLVIVGPKGWLYKPVLQKISTLDLDEHVIMTGYVEDQDLVALYNGADLFIFPSLYEGFGLPPLEAIACGAPVASSNTSCLPEILGDAAVYFDPYNVDNIADSIMSVLDNPTLACKLRSAGPQRAARFSWEQTARQTLDVYRELG